MNNRAPTLKFSYPRPQLVRAEWTSLNGPWRFAFDDDQRWSSPVEIRHWPQEIIVPYPPECRASGVADPGFHSACWYQRDFEIEPKGDRVLLHFGAVDYAAIVWINGRRVGSHVGGHTPFTFDITSALNKGARQSVTLRAEDDPQDLTKPRGKQDWKLEPHGIWYPRTTGIWQTVWLERVPRNYIASLRWTPHVEGYAFTLETALGGAPRDGLSLQVTLETRGQLLARDTYQFIGNDVSRRIILSDPGIDDFRNEILWSPESPTLIDAVITLYEGNRELDRVESYTALRSATVSRDRFALNGRPYPLRLVLDQGYWPDTHLAAPDDEALRRDVELAKRMGFNGVRKHQKIENPRYLYWADRLGLLVWEEMPSAYRFTPTAIERTVREWTEAIERDYSHPCIVVWVPFNESWGVPDLASLDQHRHAVQALYHLTKTLDPTRPVIGNDGWESSATDIIGIHDYDADPAHMTQRYGSEMDPAQLFDRRRPGGRILTLDGYPHRGQPIVLTEFGGIALKSDTSAAKRKSATWGYSEAHTRESFTKAFGTLVRAVIEANLFSGFCYTQFADTFQEANGLLTEHRTPKIPLTQIAKVVTHRRSTIPGVV